MKERPTEQFMPDESRPKDMMEFDDEPELEEEIYPKYSKPQKSTDGIIYGQAKPTSIKALGYPCFWPKYCGRSMRGLRNEYATYFVRPKKMMTKGKMLYPDDAQRRIASSQMVQSLIARTESGAYPVYAHRNVNYS